MTRAQKRRNEIADARENRHGLRTSRTIDVHKPAEGLGYRVITRATHVVGLSHLPIARDMHNNEIRVELQKKLVVESPFLIGSPLGGLQPDICPLDEIKEDTPPLFRWDVKSNGALAPCILRPFQSDVFPHPLRAARILNLDDIGPVLGHQRGGIGLGRHRARAKHLHTVKETKIGYFLRLSHIRPFDQSPRYFGRCAAERIQLAVRS